MAEIMDDPQRALAEPYALGALDGDDRAAFETHLGSCSGCQVEVAHVKDLVASLPQGLPAAAPDPRLRGQVLDLSEAPTAPLDLAAYDWLELVPGIKVHVVREDAARHFRACLVWGRPGARHPLHRHLGDENILVLEGRIGDGRGSYGPGEICRSRTGSVHTEAVMGDEDCICYVTYYGELEMLGA